MMKQYANARATDGSLYGIVSRARLGIRDQSGSIFPYFSAPFRSHLPTQDTPHGSEEEKNNISFDDFSNRKFFKSRISTPFSGWATVRRSPKELVNRPVQHLADGMHHTHTHKQPESHRYFVRVVCVAYFKLGYNSINFDMTASHSELLSIIKCVREYCHSVCLLPFVLCARCIAAYANCSCVLFQIEHDKKQRSANERKPGGGGKNPHTKQFTLV